jgi:transcriptional regulator with XRE-family HTH domain
MVTPGFGTRIKTARERRFLSRDQLADLLGITVNAVRFFEEELRRPKWKMLTRLAHALKVTEYYLITGRTTRKNTYSRDQLHKTYTLIRTLVNDKKQLDKLHRDMLRFLAGRLRFR